MQIKIQHENFELSDDIREIVENRITGELNKRLTHFQEDEKRAVMNLEKIDYYFVAKFDLWLPNKHHIFAQEQGKDLLTEIYKVRDDVDRQLEKYRDSVG